MMFCTYPSEIGFAFHGAGGAPIAGSSLRYDRQSHGHRRAKAAGLLRHSSESYGG